MLFECRRQGQLTSFYMQLTFCFESYQILDHFLVLDMIDPLVLNASASAKRKIPIFGTTRK